MTGRGQTHTDGPVITLIVALVTATIVGLVVFNALPEFPDYQTACEAFLGPGSDYVGMVNEDGFTRICAAENGTLFRLPEGYYR